MPYQCLSLCSKLSYVDTYLKDTYMGTPFRCNIRTRMTTSRSRSMATRVPLSVSILIRKLLTDAELQCPIKPQNGSDQNWKREPWTVYECRTTCRSRFRNFLKTDDWALWKTRIQSYPYQKWSKRRASVYFPPLSLWNKKLFESIKHRASSTA